MVREIKIEEKGIISKVFFKDSSKMTEIADKKITLILTSPPYFNLKDYSELNSQKGQLSASPEVYYQSFEEYLSMLRLVFEECYRVLSDNGMFIINVDVIRIKTEDKNVIPLPFHIIKLCEQIGFGCKDILIYKKLTGNPFHFGKKLKSRHEYLLLFAKSNDYKWNLDTVRIPYPKNYIYPEGHKRRNPLGKTPSTVWDFYPPYQSGGKNHYHYCPFPYGLVDRAVKLFTDKGDWILDPFLGSGQVIARARFLQRNAIGFEINEDFHDLIHEKITGTAIGKVEEINRLVDYTAEKNEKIFNKKNKHIRNDSKRIDDFL